MNKGALMLRLAVIIGFFGLIQCDRDESVAAYGAAGQVWTLTELDGGAFTARATMTFPKPGKISGQAACNSYQGTMDTPYPWFDAQQIVTTRMACPDLAAETAFLAALADMTQSEVSGDTMILTNESGRVMLFKASG